MDATKTMNCPIKKTTKKLSFKLGKNALQHEKNVLYINTQASKLERKKGRPMNSIYQYSGVAINTLEGIEYRTCVKTYQELLDWEKKIGQIKGIGQISLSSGRGIMPYGESQRYFNVRKYMENLNEWLGDYEITGSD